MEKDFVMSFFQFLNIGKRLECRCFSNLEIVSDLESILSQLLMMEGATDLLINTLINKAQGMLYALFI